MDVKLPFAAIVGGYRARFRPRGLRLLPPHASGSQPQNRPSTAFTIAITATRIGVGSIGQASIKTCNSRSFFEVSGKPRDKESGDRSEVFILLVLALARNVFSVHCSTS